MRDLQRCRTARPPRRLLGAAQVETLESRVVMSAAVTTVSLGYSLTTFRLGQTTTLTAGVYSSSGEVNEGTVTFRDGSNVLGTVALRGGFALLKPAELTLGSHPISVTFDGTANFLPSQSGLSRSNSIRTVAGNGTLGYSGDGGLALSAQLTTPRGLATDALGNTYIGDFTNNVVRKVTPEGIISTIAGNGTAGYSGDGGSATSAQLSYPNSLAVDASGNLYISDQNNGVIRRVTPEGLISTVVGTGTPGFSGDGGPATSAQLNIPTGLAFDSAGNLYIADSSNFRIRKVTPERVISTVAGNGEFGYTGGGPATSTPLYQPTGLAVDASGNVYFSFPVNQLVAKLSTDGVVSTVAGIESQGFSGDGGPATSAKLSFPDGLAVDISGNLYIANINGVVRKIDLLGNISTVAGVVPHEFPIILIGENGGTAAGNTQLSAPTGLAIDAAGNLLIADSNNQRVRSVSANPVLDVTTRPSGFRVTGLDSPVTAGAERNITVVALDADGNPLVDFDGYVSFTSSDPQSSASTEITTGSMALPPFNAIMLVNGTGSGIVRLGTAGTQTVSFTDSAELSQAGVAAVVDVIPGQATRFGVTFASNFAVEATPITVTATAYDAFGNVATGYNGRLAFPSYTFARFPQDLRAINGVATFEVSTFGYGSLLVTVADEANSTIIGTSDFLLIQPAKRGMVVFDTIATNDGRQLSLAALADRVVYLDVNGNGELDSNEPTATTSQQTGGFFQFFGVTAYAPYQVLEASQLSPDLRNVVVQSTTRFDGFVTLTIAPISSVAPVPIVPAPFEGPISTDTNVGYVHALYRAVLGRDGSTDEVGTWAAGLASGMSRQSIAAGIVNSPEHRLQQVTSYYRTFLQRELDPFASVWVEQLRNGVSETDVVAGLLDSPEFRTRRQDNTAFVKDVYSGVLGREADPTGLADKTALLNDGMSRATIVSRTLNSDELIDQVLDSYYRGYLQRERDATSSVWAESLRAPGGSPSDVAIGILASDEFFQKVRLYPPITPPVAVTYPGLSSTGV